MSSTETIDVKQSEHTGLLFPSGRVWHHLDTDIAQNHSNSCKSISPSAAIFLSATLELLTSELLQLAGNAAKKNNKHRIDPSEISNAIKNDPEFSAFYSLKESKARLSSPSSPIISIKKPSIKQLNLCNEEEADEADMAKLDKSRRSHKILPPKDSKAKISLSLNPFGVSIEGNESPSHHLAMSRLSVPATPPVHTNYDLKYLQAANNQFWCGDEIKEKEETAMNTLTLVNYGNFPSETRETDEENEQSSSDGEDGLGEIDVDEYMSDDDNDNINDQAFISGLYYIENYINDSEHDAIVQYVNNNEWQKKSCRLVQEYGYAFDDNSDCLAKICQRPFTEIPAVFAKILKRISSDERFGIGGEYQFDQLVVDHFPSFGGLPYALHSMQCFDEYVVGISLMNEALINFRHIGTKQVKKLLFRPKSLWVLSGEARKNWEQGITQKDVHFYDGNKIKRQHRISLTFRKCLHLKQMKNASEISQEEVVNNRFLFRIDSLLNSMDKFIET